MITPTTYARSLVVKKTCQSWPRPNLLIDAGCGNCFFLTQVEAKHKIGVDLNMARFALPDDKTQGIKCDIRFMPFKETTVDCVMSLEAIEHVKEDESVIAESYRILKNGGFLLLTTPTENEYLPIPLRKLPGLDTAKLHRQWGHVRPGYNRNQLANLVEQHHFQIISYRTCVRRLTRVLETLIYLPLQYVYNYGKSGEDIYKPKQKGALVSIVENALDLFFLRTLAYLILWIENQNNSDGFTHVILAKKMVGKTCIGY